MKAERLIRNELKKSSRYSVLLSFFYNVLRWIPNILFGIPYFIYYFILSIVKREKYLTNKSYWLGIYNPSSKLEDIVNFFYKSYKYKYDLFGGLFDHDSSIFEWIYAYGDCDDRALYLKKCLKKIGIPAIRIGLKGKGLTSLHFEVIYTIYDEKTQTNQYCMIYRTEILTSTSIQGLLFKFGERWNGYDYYKTKYCACLY